MHIEHQPEDQTFYATSHGYEGELSYSRPENGVVDFNHTYVDEELRGKGVADQLAAKALDWAAGEKLRVRTSCPYMAKFVEKNHAKYQQLLA
ncbi:GNAT family N-acetyltransferase [Hymenobacter latericus]|uniref:GNAT family N-acetyltransferase n=1 Tax=Hymenobacter sp. YIM 151858-1 TaxID=2987688 RepID=UPI002226BAC5|nr:GNAT family N-acetyltransferase [Hymenobacter sp. YIM 151858-1]UYZ60843.1 N-acetyltransferase [Hymenobacter sp. YIM 151858-1]